MIAKQAVQVVLDNGEVLFPPHALFPWFRDASPEQIAHVVQVSPGHLYWPALDVDLDLDSIRRPENFPLVSQIRAPNT